MKRPEQEMHLTIAKHIRQRGASDLVWFHVPNGARYGGKSAAMHGAIMKRLGVRAGVSDFIFLRNGLFYAMELKALGGRPTQAQQEFISDVNKAGGFAVCVNSPDIALRCLESWGLIEGKSTFEPISNAAERVVSNIRRKNEAA